MALESRFRPIRLFLMFAICLLPIRAAGTSSIEVLSVDEETIAGLPWLGVYFSELTPELVKEHDLEDVAGVYITKVIPGSPAEEAQLAERDVITAFDGAHIRNAEEFGRAVRINDPGDEVKIKILRAGERKTVRARLIARPTQEGFSASPPPNFLIRYRPPFGADLAELDEGLAVHFAADPGRGLLVTRVEPASAADRAGLKSGDLLLKADGRSLAEVGDLDEVMSHNQIGHVELDIQRGRERLRLDAPYKQITGDERTLNHSVRALEEVLKGLAANLEFDEETAERELEALAKEFAKLRREFRESDEYADIRAALKELERSLQKKLQGEQD